MITNKQIVLEQLIHRTQEKVWWLWTTNEGLKTFFGYDNQITLLPGGPFEIYFLKDNPPGLRGSETCKVLSFLPNRMLSFTWNAPPQFKTVRESSHRTWVVIELMAIDADQTLLRLTHLGWPAQVEWEPVFEYFEQAWKSVLTKLASDG
jgi:uncharacterized protein YndB with AHSA1/START domain